MRLLGRYYVGLRLRPGGAVRAMDVTCGHQGANLLAGSCQGDVVTCVRHQWRYNLESGACLNQDAPALKEYPVKIADGWVLVGLGMA